MFTDSAANNYSIYDSALFDLRILMFFVYFFAFFKELLTHSYVKCGTIFGCFIYR